MPEFAELIAAAFRAERVRARTLARRSGCSEQQALRQTLTELAGAAGLANLLERRRQLRDADAARLATKRQARAAMLATRAAARSAPATAWQAWFDGSAHPNPGRIGIGALLLGPGGERVELSQPAGMGSSSEAEYAALNAVLAAAVSLCPPELVVFGDSQVVIDDVNCSADGGAPSLQAQRAVAAALLAQLPKVTLRWIPRHRNAAADRLSQQAIAAWHAAAEHRTDHTRDRVSPT